MYCMCRDFARGAPGEEPCSEIAVHGRDRSRHGHGTHPQRRLPHLCADARPCAATAPRLRRQAGTYTLSCIFSAVDSDCIFSAVYSELYILTVYCGQDRKFASDSTCDAGRDEAMSRALLFVAPSGSTPAAVASSLGAHRDSGPPTKYIQSRQVRSYIASCIFCLYILTEHSQL